MGRDHSSQVLLLGDKDRAYCEERRTGLTAKREGQVVLPGQKDTGRVENGTCQSAV